MTNDVIIFVEQKNKIYSKILRKNANYRKINFFFSRFTKNVYYTQKFTSTNNPFATDDTLNREKFENYIIIIRINIVDLLLPIYIIRKIY